MELKFRITGMTCAACSARVEKVTTAVPGVERVNVNLLSGSMTADVQTEDTAERIILAVQSAGYDAAIWGAENTARLSVCCAD